jgi:hypothetical protein
MRFINYPLFSDVPGGNTQVSSPQDTSFILRSSVQVIVDGDAAGTLSVQISNDKIVDANLAQNNPPTNWATLDMDETIAGAGVYLVPKFDLSYTWMRLSYESTYVAVQEITTVADVATSLEGTYFFISSPSTDYYLYIKVDGNGTDPEVPDMTGVIVNISEDDTAADVATAVETALDGIAGTPFAAATIGALVTVTNSDVGSVTAASDNDTGFTFDLTNPAGTISANIKSIGM